jgi:hypothetical protein
MQVARLSKVTCKTSHYAAHFRFKSRDELSQCSNAVCISIHTTSVLLTSDHNGSIIWHLRVVSMTYIQLKLLTCVIECDSPYFALKVDHLVQLRAYTTLQLAVTCIVQ